MDEEIGKGGDVLPFGIGRKGGGGSRRGRCRAPGFIRSTLRCISDRGRDEADEFVRANERLGDVVDEPLLGIWCVWVEDGVVEQLCLIQRLEACE